MLNSEDLIPMIDGDKKVLILKTIYEYLFVSYELDKLKKHEVVSVVKSQESRSIIELSFTAEVRGSVPIEEGGELM